MMKGLIGIALFFVGIFAWAANWEVAPPPEDRVKIGVLDTGIDLTVSPRLKPFLCRGSHTSIVDDDPFSDGHKSLHGTNVAGLIADNLDSKKHCLVIIKFYSDLADQGEFKDFVRLGIEHAIAQRLDYLNISIAGLDPSHLEFLSLQEALKKGMKLSVAAGNGTELKGRQVGVDLGKRCNFFPACYKFRMGRKDYHVVGSIGSKFSNYGKPVTHLENGNNVGTPILSGTSQATAIHTGKWVKADTK